MLLKMSKEFPFINEDAEGMREGNKTFEEQFSNHFSKENYIKLWKDKMFLALSESVETDASQGELWHLSSIFSLGQDGNTQIQRDNSDLINALIKLCQQLEKELPLSSDLMRNLKTKFSIVGSIAEGTR